MILYLVLSFLCISSDGFYHKEDIRKKLVSLKSSIIRTVIKNWNIQFMRRMHLVNKKAYVNGKWVTSSTGKEFDVINPADGSVVGSVPDMNVDDAQMAIDAAAKAFNHWKFTTAKERSILLRKWYDLMEINKKEIAEIMTYESGKPVKEAIGEVTYGNSFVEWFSEEARRIDGEIIQSPTPTKQIFLMKQPIGAVGLLTPWNFPHAMITRKSAAALAAGCTCVIKPAEDTPLTALAIAKLASEAGIPEGVFNVITCSRSNAPSIGKLLCESPKIAGISFTGSTEVGKLLYSQCSSGLKRIGLELGGNAPFIVFKSADIDKAVQGAMQSKFRNCGQTCVSSNRFLVEEDVYDAFVEKFKKAISEQIVLGNGMQENVTVGPLINKEQMKKVGDMVNDAVQKGAKVMLGGKPASSIGELFYEPTIVTGITNNMKLCTEEVFGPVAAIFKFKNESEAIEIANSTNRGLAGYFYSSDIAQVFRVVKSLELGMVGANEGMISTCEAAFGGIKESGIGREGSHHGIEDYIYIKYMCLGNI